MLILCATFVVLLFLHQWFIEALQLELWHRCVLVTDLLQKIEMLLKNPFCHNQDEQFLQFLDEQGPSGDVVGVY